MKDIIIKGSVLKRELFILLGCFVAAYGANIYAVLHYSRPASELISTIGYVIVLMLCIYAALWILRLVVLLIRSLLRLCRR